MSDENLRKAIQERLQAFAVKPLAEAAIGLLDALGYRSDRLIADRPMNAATFVENYDLENRLNREQALVDDWRSVDLLFQMSDEEVRNALQLQMAFESREVYDDAIVESFLFAAVDLTQAQYTRQKLAAATRAMNRLFPMPVIVIFRHGQAITLSIIRRRLHKREASKDVLEKVTLIKDIEYIDPLRSHIEMLADLALPSLHNESFFHNFVGLHRAWEKRLDAYQLNQRFYRDVANWYLWALDHPQLKTPRNVVGEEQRAIFLIRLLTRLIFCWFLQEKKLIPRQFFYRRTAQEHLKDFGPASGTYYRAFLQNLFFATLNLEMKDRGFRYKNPNPRGLDGQHGINAYRYADFFVDSKAFEDMLRPVPFLNGGLFERLDQAETKPKVYLDDFSEHSDSSVHLPNELFFGEEREVDLSHAYEDKRRSREKVRGLIEILGRYKFTIEENTPLEEEVALDPELLGQVFENLLASYNEETRTTARKATGSFYTPREIVGYMVDEALVAYLSTALPGDEAEQEEHEAHLRRLLDPGQTKNPFSPAESALLVAAIDRAKILDPACGSGAFPMGMLHRLVELLRKLDPDNTIWRDLQKKRVRAEIDKAYDILDVNERRQRLAEIDEVFEKNNDDYGRKLYLIENSIFGVDIQPIAVQITKLRFFISLIVDQREDPNAPNRGVRSLPNLETKIVAADSLVFVEKVDTQMSFLDAEIETLRNDLAQVRHQYFNARNLKDKTACKEQDRALRCKIADQLEMNGWPADDADRLADWDPYNQNQAAPFFDPEWMYGLASNGSFDIVIGNPPYVRIQTLKQRDPKMVQYLKDHYISARKGNYDIYVVFVEQGLRLLQPKGNLAYILPHKFFNAVYGEPLRSVIAEGKHLSHVVHMGDHQVFPGATNYVCLLFLSKSPSNVLRFVQVDDIGYWLNKGDYPVSQIPSSQVTSQEWNFVVGQAGKLQSRLDLYPLKLRDISLRIFQGPITSADSVFLFEEYSSENEAVTTVFSKAQNSWIQLETTLLKPVVRGGGISAYYANASALVLFPYKVEANQAVLRSIQNLQQRFPLAWDYLCRNQVELESREGGKFRDQKWYRFGRTQNLGLWEQPKILVPYMVNRLASYYDSKNHYYLINVTTGGYGITLKDSRFSYSYISALLNSSVLDFILRNISTNFRGGYYAANKQYIERLPIPEATFEQQSLIGILADYITILKSHEETSGTEKQRRLLQIGYFEQIINGLVYELFFQSEMHAHRLTLFHYVAQANLPKMELVTESEQLQTLTATFERLYELNHPIRSVLHTLRSLEPIRIIEGNA